VLGFIFCNLCTYISILTNKLHHSLISRNSCWDFIPFEIDGRICLVNDVILWPMMLAIFYLPEEIVCSPCHVNSFLVRFMSIKLTCWNILQYFMQLPITFITWVSSFMQEDSSRSYLCGALIVMTLICLSKERPTWCHLFYYYFIQYSKCFEC